MGVDEHTTGSLQQRPWSPLHAGEGVTEGKGEKEVVGMLVGRNQTGPNYRNHNESVSRGTLLPGKHHQKHSSSTHSHQRSEESQKAQVPRS